MLRRALLYGLLAGLIVAVPMVAFWGFMDGMPTGALGMAIGYLTMLVAFTMVPRGILAQRTAAGGTLAFLRAFVLGLGISSVSGVCYVVAWEATQAMTGMDFAGDYARSVLEARQAKGATPEEMATLTTQMDAFKADYAKPLYRLPMTFAEIFPVGVVVSLVSALVLRKRARAA